METLEGEFKDGWAENTETQNTAPYASYCKFRVVGDHGKDVGTRAVGTLQNGDRRYSTVMAVEYEYEGNVIVATVFTLKDYQFKRYMTDAQPSITFGNQPFPVCHPEGYMIGMNLLGMAWYNGNRIVAGKVADFQTEYALPPIASDPLNIGEWYHVCMTYDEDGKTNLYHTKLGVEIINTNTSKQSISKFTNTDGFGYPLKVHIGADNWHLSPLMNSPVADYKSHWEYSSSMDICLLRFHHRALKKDEARLFLLEAFHGVFVADDAEAAQLIGAGLVPITL